MSDPHPATFTSRLSRTLQTVAPTSVDGGIAARAARLGPVAQFRPRPAPGLKISPLGQGEGLLLESADGRHLCRLNEDERVMFEQMDGTCTVMELFYRDMARRGQMALDRVGGLVTRLRRNSMLEGEFDVAERVLMRAGLGRPGTWLERLAHRLAYQSWFAGRLGWLLRLLGPVGRLASTSLGVAVIALLAFLAFFPAAAVLKTRPPDLLKLQNSYRGGLLLLVALSWGVYSLRHVVAGAVLAGRGVTGVALNLGLAYGGPGLWLDRRSRLRAGPRQLSRALVTGLFTPAALGGLVIGAVHFSGAGRTLGPPGVGVEIAVRLAVVSLLWLIADLCPMLPLFGLQAASVRADLPQLGPRALSFLVRKLPGRLLFWRSPPTVAPDGTPAPAVSAARILTESWYMATGLWTITWVTCVALASTTVVRESLIPLVDRFLVESSLGHRLLLGSTFAGLALPLLVSLTALLLWSIHQVIRLGGGPLWRLDISLYVPAALGTALAVPVIFAWLDPAPFFPTTNLLILVCSVMAPLVAWNVASHHRGSRLESAFHWLGVFHLCALLELPLLLTRCELISVHPMPARWLFALDSLSYLLLFPFLLFVYLEPRGRWMAMLAVLAPFGATMAYFGPGQGALMATAGMAFVAIVGTFSFAVMAFFTLMYFLDTPVSCFWAFLSLELGLSTVARVPRLMVELDPTGSENLTFVVACRGIAAMMALFALGGHRLAFRRLQVPNVAGSVERITTEALALADGFVRLANGLLETLANHLGPSRAHHVAQAMSQRLTEVDLPFEVTADRLVLTRRDGLGEVFELTKRIQRVAGDLYRGFARLAGEDVLRRALVLVQDRMYWVEKELVNYFLFKDVALGAPTYTSSYALDGHTRVTVLSKIPLLAALSPRELSDLSFRLRRVDVLTGDIVIRQGDRGDTFFIILEGELEVLQEDPAGLPQRVATLGALDCFGEVALLEGVPRTATVRALVPSILLALSEADFRMTLAATPEAAARVTPLIRQGGFLARIPLFMDLPPTQILNLARRLTEQKLPAGSVVVTEGDPGDRFFLVREGALDVNRGGASIGRLGPGEYFGEIALLTNQPRVATVTARTDVVLLSLGKEDFYGVLATFLSTFRTIEQFAHRRLYQIRSPGGA